MLWVICVFLHGCDVLFALYGLLCCFVLTLSSCDRWQLVSDQARATKKAAQRKILCFGPCSHTLDGESARDDRLERNVTIKDNPKFEHVRNYSKLLARRSVCCICLCASDSDVGVINKITTPRFFAVLAWAPPVAEAVSHLVRDEGVFSACLCWLVVISGGAFLFETSHRD